MSHSPCFAGPQTRLALAIRRCLGVSLSGALLSLPLTALAQDDAVAEEMDTMVVLGTALKVEAPLIETPRSASVVTREELNARNVQKLDETFRYRAGVLSGHFGADNDTDWFKVRGFNVSTYQDGLKLIQEGYYVWMLEPFGLERVELLKGPASILYGEAPPGGVVNAISKRPTEEPRGVVELQVGNRDHRQVGIDTSGPVTESGDVRYRMVGLYSERDGVLDGTYNERYYFAPSLEVDLSDDTTVTFLASVKKDDGVPTNGFFLPYGTLEDTPFGRVDPSTNLGEPGYDKNERTQVALGYQFEHYIDDTWKFEQNLRYNELDLELRSVYALAMLNDREVSRGLVYRDGEANSWAIDNRLIGKWYTLNTENTLLLGVDYQKLEIDSNRFDSYSFGQPLDIFDPAYGNFTPVTDADLQHEETEQEQLGLYVQNQLRLNDKWVFLASARFDQAETSTVNHATGVEQGYDINQWSLSGGIMYLADNGLSPYLSYAESFQPIAATDGSGELYEPLEGKQIEAGVKYAPPGFDGYVTAAVYELTQENSLVTDLDNPSVQTQAGEVESRGFELEGVGYLTDNLKLIAAYTYIDATTNQTSDQEEERLALIPRHAASAWLNYSFTGGTLDGFSVGGGVRYVGESVGSAPSGEEVSVDSYTLYDVMGRYDFNEHWRAQLNVNNLTDEEYVSACDYFCYYGESRSVIGSLSYRW